MQHSEIWQDMTTSVRRAINQRLHLLHESDLTDQSDRLLAMLPVVGSEQPTTALLFRRYHGQLHAELCNGTRPRQQFSDLEQELLELTRAVIVTFDTSEGISVENAVLMALILRAQGLARFCAQPIPRSGA